MKQTEEPLQAIGDTQAIRRVEDTQTTSRPLERRLKSEHDTLGAFKSKPILLQALGSNPEEDDSRYGAVCRGWD